MRRQSFFASLAKPWALLARPLACAAACLLPLALIALVTVANTAVADAQTRSGDSVRQRGPVVPFTEQWARYKARFMHRDGRIIDTGNRNISHTESQGTGMLFSLFANDPKSFAQIWRWTDSHLRREDGLYSWRYDPSHPDTPVSDPNNATDGDLMIAWALLMAGNVWDRPSYTEAAEGVIDAIEARVVQTFANRHILLPGVQGYDGFGRRTLNLSYCVFPALQEIAAHTRSETWVDIYRDCLMFAQTAAFGDLSLPLDWMTFDEQGALAPAPVKPKRFGYDAIRVPLYLVWAGHNTPRYISRYSAAWRPYPSGEAPPSWIDPFTGETSTYRAANGFLAVRQLVDLAAFRNEGQISRASQLTFPAVTQDDDYYSASLVMFSTLAAMSMGVAQY